MHHDGLVSTCPEHCLPDRAWCAGFGGTSAAPAPTPGCSATAFSASSSIGWRGWAIAAQVKSVACPEVPLAHDAIHLTTVPAHRARELARRRSISFTRRAEISPTTRAYIARSQISRTGGLGPVTHVRFRFEREGDTVTADMKPAVRCHYTDVFSMTLSHYTTGSAPRQEQGTWRPTRCQGALNWWPAGHANINACGVDWGRSRDQTLPRRPVGKTYTSPRPRQVRKAFVAHMKPSAGLVVSPSQATSARAGRLTHGARERAQRLRAIFRLPPMVPKEEGGVQRDNSAPADPAPLTREAPKPTTCYV